MKKKVISKFFAICIILSLFLGLMLVLISGNLFQDLNKTDFDNGVYNLTFYNSSGFLQLSPRNLTGNYVSRVFDGGGIVRWNNLSWNGDNTDTRTSYAVDGQGKVYSSSDSGLSWTLKNSSYGRTTDTQDMFSDTSGNLYIITSSNREVWKSTNDGINWVKINDSFSNKDLLVGEPDSSNNLYVIAGTSAGVVWKSNDSGVSWTQINSSYNNGNGAAKGLTWNGSALYAVDGQGKVYSSSDSGLSWTLKNSSYGRTTDTQDMFSDTSGNLYIITNSNKEVWKSTDNGVSWAKINDTFSNLGLLTGMSDNNGYIYVIAGTSMGIVYRSANGGISWMQVNASYNNGNGAARGMTSVLKQTNLTFQVRNCSLPDCSDAGFVSPDLSNINLTGRYFQYRINFTTEDFLMIPKLYNTTIDYTILDNISPLVSVVSPLTGNYTLQTINFNVSLNEEGNSCLYSLDNWQTNHSMTKLNNTYFYDSRLVSDGFYTSRFSCTDNFGNVNNTATRSFGLDSTVPVVKINSPQNGGSYGYNESINLDFSANDINGISSCWYNIDNGNNISLINCLNISFGVPGNGNYIIAVYANDSFGLVSSYSVSFNVQIGAPTIILISPIDVYLNNSYVEFRYIPNDIDLRSCELWGDFDGVFKLNQTNNNPINDTVNSFYLNLNDRTYLWNIRCNDSQAHSAFNGNKSFVVDTIKPILNISEPAGTKTARTGILFIFNITEDNKDSCWYNVYRGVNLEIQNTTINCSTQTNFNVTVDADFVLNLYANDSAGNFNSISSSFNVDTSSNPPNNGGSSGGGGSGGGTITFSNASSKKANIEVSNIGDIIAKPGDKKTLSLTAKNIGKIFLNNCRLIVQGEISSWIYSKDIFGIAPGENKNFVFDLNVPDRTMEIDYSGGISINCDEASHEQKIKISIPKGLQSIKIKEIKKDKNSLNIIYTYEGDVGKVDVEIWMSNGNNVEYKRIKDSFSAEGGIIERTVVIDIPEDLAGIYSVYIALSSDLNNSIRESVVLGETSTTGFAIFDQPRNKTIAYAVFILIILGGILFIIFGWGRKNKIISKKTIKEDYIK